LRKKRLTLLLLILPLVLLLVLLIIYLQLQLSRVSNSATLHIQPLRATIKVEWSTLSDPKFLKSLAGELERTASESPAVRLLKENPGRVAVLEVKVTVTNNAWHGKLYVTSWACTSSIKKAVMKLKEVKEDDITFANILVRPIKGEVYRNDEHCLLLLVIKPLSWGESIQNVHYYIILRPSSREPFEAELLISVNLCRSAGENCKWHDLTVKVNW